MKRNIIGQYARQIVNELFDLSSTHRSAHRTSAQRGKQIGGAEQAKAAPARVSQTQELSGKTATDLRAALNTWEGEGGSTAGTRQLRPSEI